MSDREFYGVFVSLEGDTVLLPNVAIAEVTGHAGVEPVPGAPVWWCGNVRWGGTRVPLVSLEALNGKPLPAVSRRSRIAVINSLGVALGGGQFAVVCQGYPHLVTLNRAAIAAEALDPDDDEALVLCRARIANTRVLVPDLEQIERRLAQARDAIEAVA